MKYAFYKVFLIPEKEKKLFFEAYFISLKVRIGLVLHSFNKYSEKLGEKGKMSNAQPDIDNILLNEIKYAIKRAVKYSLWRNKCMEQAITAKRMLSKRGIDSTIYFGVRKNNEKLEAHSWLKMGDVFIVGEKQSDAYTVVSFYT